jgi:PIN domain nuclease of toxin-antitoxin system
MKRVAGKLRAPMRLRERLEAENFEALSITVEHAIAAARLPRHHGDPFDRVLAAQAQIERLTLVTRDPVFARYGVPVLAA